MYRSSSDYRFAVRPSRRRGSISDLIEKYNVLSESRPSESAKNIFYYNDISNYHQKMYRNYQSHTNDEVESTDYIKELYHDEEKSSKDDPSTVLNKLAGMVLPFWLILKPILETITVAPLPLFFSVTGTGIFALLVIFILPRTFSELLLYPGFRLVFGTLYPAYASYKAVRTKNVKEYVRKCFFFSL